MKLHLPKLLRNSVLACITAVAGIATTTVGTATFTGGVVAFALSQQQAVADWAADSRTGGYFYYYDQSDNPGIITAPVTNSNGYATAADALQNFRIVSGNANKENVFEVLQAQNGCSFQIVQNPWQTDSTYSPLSIQKLIFGSAVSDSNEYDGTGEGAFLNKQAESTISINTVRGALSGVENAGTLTLGSTEGTIKLAGSIENTGTLNLVGKFKADTMDGFTLASGGSTTLTEETHGFRQGTLTYNLATGGTINRNEGFSFYLGEEDITSQLSIAESGITYATSGTTTVYEVTSAYTTAVEYDGTSGDTASATGFRMEEGTTLVLKSENFSALTDGVVVDAGGGGKVNLTVANGQSQAFSAVSGLVTVQNGGYVLGIDGADSEITTTNSGGTGFYQGEVRITNGGKLSLNNYDALGWGGTATPKISILNGTLAVGGRQTCSTDIEMLGGAVIEAAANPLTGSNAPMIQTHSGFELTVSGTDNKIASNVDIKMGIDTTVTVAEDGELSILGAITQDKWFFKEGAGKLILDGADKNLVATMWMNAGTLVLGGTVEGGGVTTFGGGIYHTDGVIEVGGQAVVNGNSTFGTVTVKDGGDMALNGTSTLGATTVKAGGNLTLGGTITWTSEVAVDAGGSLTLSGLHTVGGKLTIAEGGKVYAGAGMSVDTDSMVIPEAGTNGWESGTVTLLKVSADGTETGLSTVWQGGTEHAVTKTTQDGETIYTFAGYGNKYYVQNTAEAVEYSDATGLTGASVIYMSDGTTLNLKASPTSALADGINIADNATVSLGVEGSGVTLSTNKLVFGEGARADFTLDAGILQIDNENLGAAIKSVNMSNGAVLRVQHAFTANVGTEEDAVEITMTGNSQISLNNGNTWGPRNLWADILIDGQARIGGSSNGNNSTIRGTIAGAGTLELLQSNGSNSYTIASMISDGAGEGESLAVNVTSGKVVLSGSNTYTGGTTISGGIVTASSETALGHGDVVVSEATLQLGADLVIKGNFEQIGGGSNIVFATNDTAYDLTIEGAFNGVKQTILFGESGKSSTVTIEGNLTSEQTVGLSSGVDADNMNVLKINGASNTFKSLKVSEVNFAEVIFGADSVTTLSGVDGGSAILTNGVNSNTSLQFEQNARLTDQTQKVTFIGGESGSMLRKNAATGNSTYTLASGEYTLTNLGVEVDTAAGELTVGNLLTNSSVTNTGANLLTVNNAGNTLSEVVAQGGNVKVVNSTTSQVSISSVTAAADKSVTTEIADLSLGALTLNGGTFATNGNLLLNALAVDVQAYTFDSSTQTELVQTLVTVDGTLTLADGLDLSTLVSGTDDFTASLSQDGNNIVLTLSAVAIDPKVYYWEGDDNAYWGANSWSQKDGKSTDLINIATGLPEGITEADLTLVFSNSGTAESPNTMKLNAAKTVTAIVVKNGYYEFTMDNTGSGALTCTGDLTLAAADTSHNLVGGHLLLNKDFTAANVNMGAGSSLEINKTIVLTGLADTAENDGKFIIQGAGASIILGGDASLTQSQIDTTAEGASVSLSGTGSYDLGTGIATLTAGVTLSDSWSGTVKVTDATLTAFDVDTLAGGSDSTVEFSGVSGYLSKANTTPQTYTANMKLTDKEGASAITFNNGWGGDERTFAGSVSGDGTMERYGDKGTGQNYTFSGDTSGWNGTFKNNLTRNDFSTSVTFNGSTEINADIINAGVGTLNVTLDDANITADDKSIAVNSDITASSLTLGQADDAAVVALNGAVTVGTLNNYATTTIGGATSVTGATTLGADVTVSGDSASLSLAGTVNTTADAMVTGATVTAGGISTSGVGALALTNTTVGGNITNTGTLTMSGSIAATASATVSGATVGGNTVTCGEGATLTLQNISITSTITNNGTLALTGTVDAGVEGTGPVDTYSNTTTGNGYLTQTMSYELVSGTAATATDVTWTVGGEAIDAAETPAFNGNTLTVATTDTVNYYINNDAVYADTDTEYDAAGAVKLNGAELTLTTALKSGLGITVAADSSIKLNGEGVELASSSITNTDNKTVSLKGAGIYNVGSSLVLEKSVALDSTGWIGTIRTAATESAMAYTADSQLFGGSKIDLTADIFTAKGNLHAGDITGKALTLQAATNSVGALTLSGALTLGESVSSLTAGTLNVAGGVTVNNVAANLISAGTVENGLTLNIAETLLDTTVAVAQDKKVALLTLTGEFDDAALKAVQDSVLLGAFTADGTAGTTQEGALYDYSLEWDGKTLNLVAAISAAGYIWDGDTDYAWETAGNWGANTVPDADSAVFLTGGERTNVLISSEAKAGSITVEDWTESRQNLNLGGTGSLAVTKDVTLNNGSLNVMVDTTVGGNVVVNGSSVFAVESLEGTAKTVQVAGNLTNNNEVQVMEGGTLDITGDVVNNGSIVNQGGTLSAGSMTNSDTLAVIGGDVTVTGALTNTGTVETQDGTLTIGSLANEGTVSVEGGSVTVNGSVDNDGSIAVTGGEVAINGDLDNEGGDIAVGSATTTGSLTVTGNLTGTGATDKLTVEQGSSLAVGGDLTAADVDLEFGGNVTVGGDVKVNDLTINKGASFTANGGEDTTVDITTLTNDGTLSVGKDVDGTLTGGNLHIGTLDGSGSVAVGSNGTLDITTLNGTGDVIVGEGGTLSITNDVTFAGTIDNKGTLVTNETMTLTTQTTTGGTIEAKDLVVNEGANGSTFTSITTDTITIDKLTAAPTLTTDAVAAKTAGGKITINLTQLIPDENGAWDSATIIDGGADAYHLLKINSDVAVSELFTLNLDSDVEQEILAAGLKAELWDGKTTEDSVSWLAADEESNVLLNVRGQTDEESIWTVGKATSEAGLVVQGADGKLVSNTILDNVRKVEVDGAQEIDLTGDISKVTLNSLTALGDDSVLSIQGDGAADTATMNGEYTGELSLKNVTADMDLTGTTVVTEDDTVVLKGTITDGMLEVQQDKAAQGDGLELDDTTLRVVIGSDFTTMSDADLSALESSIVDLGNTTSNGSIEIGTYNADGEFIASAGYEKYFDMSTIKVDANGNVVADRNDSYYSDNFVAESANGAAGMTLADAALLELNPQLDSDLGQVLSAIETAGSSEKVDELGAALAGASTAALGMAVSGDVDRQLKAIRNRTTTMGVDQSVVNEDMPYFNAWINAEGDRRELSESGTEAGYELNSWGGTVGFDVDFTPTFTAGMALTAMYGDLDVTGADKATGDLDTQYVSVFARYCDSAWTHTFVGTVGMSDISLNRTVAGVDVEGETEGMSFGLMYEVGRVFALTEDGSACLQPVFNVTWKHSSVDGYTEKGSDLALEVDEQTVDTVTFGVGARLQAVVGESMYNRTSILEARVLAKADVGDRNGSADVALAALPGTKASVESAEMGAFGLEAGAGLTIPVGEEGGSIFMDASVELRSDYTNVNGTVGYRINF